MTSVKVLYDADVVPKAPKITVDRWLVAANCCIGIDLVHLCGILDYQPSC